MVIQYHKYHTMMLCLLPDIGLRSNKNEIIYKLSTVPIDKKRLI